MSRASSAQGSASGHEGRASSRESGRGDVGQEWRSNNQPLLVVSLCGFSAAMATSDFLAVVRFAIPVKGLHASENQALHREAESLAPQICKDLREIGLEPPEQCGEISLDGMFFVQNILGRCGHSLQWRPRLQLCASLAEEKAAWRSRAKTYTVVARQVILQERTPGGDSTMLPDVALQQSRMQERTPCPTPRSPFSPRPIVRRATPQSRQKTPRESSAESQGRQKSRENSAGSAHDKKARERREASEKKAAESYDVESEHDKKAAECRAESQSALKLRYLSKTLVKLHSQLLKLSDLMQNDRECLEAHKDVLQHQFVTLMGTTMERELAITELEEESHRWAYQCELGLIGKVMTGVDSNFEEVAEDSVAGHLLKHFDRSELALVEHALSSNMDDVVFLEQLPSQTSQPTQASRQLLGNIMNDVRNVLVYDCAQPQQERWPAEAASAPSGAGGQPQPDSDKSPERTRFPTESLAKAAEMRKRRYSEGNATATSILVLLRRMLWDSSLGEPEPRYRDPVHGKMHTIRLNMASALMTQSLQSLQNVQSSSQQRAQRYVDLNNKQITRPDCHPKNRDPEMSPELQDSGQIIASVLNDALVPDEECELFTIHSDDEGGGEESETEEYSDNFCDTSDSLKLLGNNPDATLTYEGILLSANAETPSSAAAKGRPRIAVCDENQPSNLNTDPSGTPSSRTPPASPALAGERQLHARPPSLSQAENSKKRPLPFKRRAPDA